MRMLILLAAAMAAAPLRAVEVAPVRVAPVDAAISAASMVGAQMRMQLANPGLAGLTSVSVTSKLSVPALSPSVIPSAPQLAPQAAYAAPAAGSVLSPAVAASLSQQKGGAQKATPMAAVQAFVAQMDSSRASGQDESAQISERFFDESGNRGPPSFAAPEVSASDVGAPKLPPGVKKVAVDTVRSEADVERLIPDGPNSDELKAELKGKVSRMAPYQIYTYYDSVGGRFTGIDISAHAGILEQIPELQPHEVSMIKKLQLLENDIRVLVRETGKTPDLVIGDQIVEMKAVLNNFPIPKLVEKANEQVYQHGQRHGLGHGAAALDLPSEKTVPVARVQGILDSWQVGKPNVMLDRIYVLSQQDVKIFVRQADGTYRVEAPAAPTAFVQERPLAPSEVHRAQAMLRQGIEKSPVLALSL